MFGIKLLVDAIQFRSESVVVEGEYFGDDVEELPNDIERIYLPRVGFTCPFTKEKRVAVSSIGSTAGSRDREGERMSVLIHKSPPYKARVNTFGNLYLVPLALIVFFAPWVWMIPSIIFFG